MANQAAITSRAKVIRRQMRTPLPRMFNLLMGIRLAAKIKAIKATNKGSLFSKTTPPMTRLLLKLIIRLFGLKCQHCDDEVNFMVHIYWLA